MASDTVMHIFQKRVQIRSQPRLTKKDLRRDYLTSAGGPLTKSAAEVGQISKACDGNDRNGNDELGLKHPFSKSIDVSSIAESVICFIQFSYVNENHFNIRRRKVCQIWTEMIFETLHVA